MHKFDRWTVAYRKRIDDGILLDNLQGAFTCIDNTWRYWRGDPHLAEHDGHAYIFAEMYDRILRRGVIGCCEISDSGTSPWTVVLKEPWHLSYPHVFERAGKYYMIPESYVGRQIALYEAVEFPWKWKRVKEIKADIVAVDSTLFSANDMQWLLTLQHENDHEILKLFPLSCDSTVGEGLTVTSDDPNKRPGGKMLEYNGKLVRPAQDCTESYGCALNFYEVNTVTEESYEEKLIAKIRPEDVATDFKGVPVGIHTYNVSEHFETIDIKDYEIDILYYIMRPIWFVWRRIKRVLNK